MRSVPQIGMFYALELQQLLKVNLTYCQKSFHALIKCAQKAVVLRAFVLAVW